MKLLIKQGWPGAVLLLCALFSYTIARGQERPEIAISAPGGGDSASVKADGMYFDAVKAHILGDDNQADSLFKAFVKIRPDVAAAYYELSRLSMLQNNVAEASKYIKKAVALDKDNKWYKMQYAELLLANNQYEEAGDIFNELAKTESYNNDYLIRAALSYQRSGKYKEALELLDRLILKTGPDEDLLIQKQQIYLKMNDVANAAKVIDELIAQNPKEGKYYALLAELYDNNKEQKKAEEVFRKAIEAYPDDASIQLGLSEHYKKLNDPVKYKEYREKVITNKDLDAETQVSLLVAYLQELPTDAERNTEGLKLATAIVTQHGTDAQALAIYGDLLATNNQHEKATEAYKRSLAVDPSRFTVWQQLLFNYTDKKDADSLVLYSGKALRLFPNQAIVHYLNGIGQQYLNNTTAAIKAMNRAIDMQPEDNPQLLGEMYSALGDVYNITKQYALSDSCFQKALDLDSSNATVLNNYSYYLSVRGAKLELAEQMSKRSLEIRPGEATFMDTYGWILYKLGKYETAKEYIQKAVDANPKEADGTLFEHLGDVYYKLNEKDKAVEYWQRAKASGNNDPQLDKKIKERTLYE
jgi:tetratricopeptide (TPR) repeat protein